MTLFQHLPYSLLHWVQVALSLVNTLYRHRILRLKPKVEEVARIFDFKPHWKHFRAHPVEADLKHSGLRLFGPRLLGRIDRFWLEGRIQSFTRGFPDKTRTILLSQQTDSSDSSCPQDAVHFPQSIFR